MKKEEKPPTQSALAREEADRQLAARQTIITQGKPVDGGRKMRRLVARVTRAQQRTERRQRLAMVHAQRDAYRSAVAARQKATTSDVQREQRRNNAQMRRAEQKRDRLEAGVDRSQKDELGARPRWSK